MGGSYNEIQNVLLLPGLVQKQDKMVQWVQVGGVLLENLPKERLEATQGGMQSRHIRTAGKGAHIGARDGSRLLQFAAGLQVRGIHFEDLAG